MTIDLNERNILHFDEVFSENHDYFLFVYTNCMVKRCENMLHCYV